MSASSWLPPGKDWIDAFEALSTPIVAFIAALFAGLAYKLQRRRRQDELFDRRYAFYVEFREFWLGTGEGASADENPFVPFDIMSGYIERADLLFGRHVAQVLATLPETGHLGGGGRFLEPRIQEAFHRRMKLDR